MTLLTALASDLLGCLRFYSRLPIPIFAFEAKPHAMLDFARAIRMLPVAGALIALPAALIAGLATEAGLAPTLVAGLMLVASLLTTGAFHEDGLADTADGFGGGATIERKLEIMRDSRIGTYGGAALAMALLLRWSALVELLGHGVTATVAVWIALAAVSRSLALLPLVLLPAARRDGAAYAADKPQGSAFAIALILSLVLLVLPWQADFSATQLAIAVFAVALGAMAVSALAWRQIRGQTGDVAGAAQQVGEILGLCVLSLHL